MNFLKVFLCIGTKKHKRSNKYFPLPPMCRNCGYIFNYKTENEYKRALKEISKIGNK